MRIPAAALLAALALGPGDAAADAEAALDDALAREARWLDVSGQVRYGRRLLEETYAILGPDAPDPALRLAGNNLACASCHAEAGTRADALPLSAAYAAFPAYQARSGRVETIEDRVDDCMRRSMNGRPLPEGGPEMQAIVAYLRFLGDEAPDFERGDPPAPLPEPATPADPTRGASLYASDCAACHGADGAGQRVGVPGDALGYRHPPLWGPDSFNAGAGMARPVTFATFIHGAMPPTDIPGPPRLLSADTWDIAAFVLSHDRPAFEDVPPTAP
ncbi:c-type cytochrome [Amaricoccus sp.]|uniref:c-type cytochrome n=1 Tax=Amaricoccus sp. TaxID=1872485 RepID=UPI001B678279|nr:c-type cytochrome [Amaricoccus sp.]MBP7003168.1 c-type cytochrome [Amaricoccus sp.]